MHRIARMILLGVDLRERFQHASTTWDAIIPLSDQGEVLRLPTLSELEKWLSPGHSYFANFGDFGTVTESGDSVDMILGADVMIVVGFSRLIQSASGDVPSKNIEAACLVRDALKTYGNSAGNDYLVDQLAEALHLPDSPSDSLSER
ncbi:MAG: hypothetical protein ACPG4T_08195 [Nannocystaceae bacterium]